MYKCESCKKEFLELEKIPAETFYGVGSDFPNSMGYYVEVCPYCGGTFIKQKELSKEELLEIIDELTIENNRLMIENQNLRRNK